MAAQVEPIAKQVAVDRVYWPELDLLRLFAFSAVFAVHGPRIQRTAVPWLADLVNQLADGCVFGLALFFFLSSYLITTLLLREKFRTGSIHLKQFYMRRILRIWPLYYFGIVMAVLAPFIPSENRLSHLQLLEFLTFFAYLAQMANGNPFGVLWSISVEELFYGLWPWLAKGSRLVVACYLIVGLSLGSTFLPIGKSWFNPVGQFLFFASGALFAIFRSGKRNEVSAVIRFLLGIAGVVCWMHGQWIDGHWSSNAAKASSFALADAGCVLLFLAFLQMRVPENRFSQSLLYLGRISYGLYVFHLYCLRLVERMIPPAGILHLALIYGMAILLTVLIGTFSFYGLEQPFLRLRRRWTPA